MTAIIGCGRIAGGHHQPSSRPIVTHAQAYHQARGVRLVGACDTNADRRASFEAAWGVPTYLTVHEMLDRHRPDVVSVCSPPERHFEHIQACIQHPSCRLVFAEKPICGDPRQLRSIADQSSAYRTAVLVNHSRRFDPAHRELAKAISSGKYGTLVGGRADYYGGWLQNGTHLIDVLRMLLGPLAIQRVKSGVSGRRDDDCPTVKVLASGAPVTLFGFDEKHYQLFEIDLRFTGARVLLEDFGAVIRVQPMAVNDLGERVVVPANEARVDGLLDPLLHAVDRISGYLQSGEDLDATGATLADVSATMALVWEARAACLH